jgi:hypothetical protein
MSIGLTGSFDDELVGRAKATVAARKAGFRLTKSGSPGVSTGNYNFVVTQKV